METEELKNYWKKEDKRIIESVKINASYKLRSSFNRIKVKRLILLILPFIYIPLIFAFIVFPHLKNDGSIWFYVSFTFFSLSIIISYAIKWYHYIRLNMIDHTKSILQIQKEILQMEILEKKWHITSYFLVPLVVFAALRIFGSITTLSQSGVIFILLALMFLIIGYIMKIKIMIPKEYHRIKLYFEELDESENS